MNEYKSANSSLLVLKKGEELTESLTKYALENSLNGGWVNVIGGAAAVTLGFYDPASREYEWTDFSEPLEIVGLQGNLAYIDGAPFWHIHGVFSRRDHTTIGGHVKKCLVGLTGEVHLWPHGQKLQRVHDDETGLKLLTQF
jgi:uncharacterized protein